MKTKRFLNILLSLVLVLGMLPGMSLTASAAGNTTEITPSNTSGTMTITLIIKGDPAATDFDVTLPTSLAYDGTAKTASATAKSTVTGMGTITVEYYKDGTKVDSAVEIGDYTVKLKVAAGTHYNAGTVENADWKFTITKGTATVTKAPAAQTEAPQTQTEASAPAVQAERITIPKKPAKVKTKARKNKVVVSWKRIKKNKKTKALRAMIKNVEVQYSTDLAFPKETTDSRIIGKNKTKYVIRGLQRKTLYYVRVRYTDGAGGYSRWSRVKRARTK